MAKKAIKNPKSSFKVVGGKLKQTSGGKGKKGRGGKGGKKGGKGKG